MKKDHTLRIALLVTTALMVVFFAAFFWNNKPFPVGKPVDTREKLRVIAPYSIAKQRRAMEEVVAGYERENPDVHIEVEYIPREDYKRQMALRQDEGNIADVIICSSIIMPELTKMGMFRQLSPDMVRRDDPFIVEELWNSVQRDGIDYGAPLTCDPYVLLYDKDAFEQKGLDVPETWDEVLETGAGLKGQGIYALGFSANDSEVITQFYLMMLYSRGGDVYGINKEEGIRSLEDMQRMFIEQVFPPNLINQNQDDLTMTFARGQLRMIFSPLSARSFWEQQRPGFSVGVAPLPGGSESFLFLAGDIIGITRRASGRAEQFVEYIQRDGVYEQFCHKLEAMQAHRDDEPTDEQDVELYQMLDEHNKTNLVITPWFAVSRHVSAFISPCLDYDPVEYASVAASLQQTVDSDMLEK